MNRQISWRTRRCRFSGSVDDDKTPGALSSTSYNFYIEFVFGVGLEVVQHDVEVGGVSILMTGFVNLPGFALSVTDDVVTVVGDKLVPEIFFGNKLFRDNFRTVLKKGFTLTHLPSTRSLFFKFLI